LQDASTFVQAFDSMFGGFRERAQRTYELLRSPGTGFVVVAAAEPDALREASYFVERLSAENMPLCGLVANRTHPVLAADLPAAKAVAAADDLDRSGDAPLAAAVLRLHADRFTRAHPGVALVGVPALPADVHDLDGLREIGRRLAGE
jgi:anion-transporting  ArsA/GET3 family ATPase